MRIPAPSPLDGNTLASELSAAGVDVGQRDVVVEGSDVVLDVPSSQEATVRAVVSAHTGTPPPEVRNRSIVDQAISDAIAELRALADAPALPAIPTIPAGTFTTAQLSDYLRSIRTVLAAQRDANQATRAGAQQVAETLANKIRLDRGDFAHLDD